MYQKTCLYVFHNELPGVKRLIIQYTSNKIGPLWAEREEGWYRVESPSISLIDYAWELVNCS